MGPSHWDIHGGVPEDDALESAPWRQEPADEPADTDCWDAVRLQEEVWEVSDVESEPLLEPHVWEVSDLELEEPELGEEAAERDEAVYEEPAEEAEPKWSQSAEPEWDALQHEEDGDEGRHGEDGDRDEAVYE